MTASNDREYLESLRQTKNIWREKLAYFQKEYAITDSSGKIFELEHGIKKCLEQIEIVDKDIESSIQEIKQIEKITRDIESSQQGGQQKTSDILDYLYQQVQDIPILDRQIEVFGMSQKTEPVIATDWQVNMQLWMQKLVDAKHKHKELPAIVVDDVMQILLSPNRSPREARALSSFAMQCLLIEVDWKSGTVNFVISKAIEHLNELDGFNNSLNTSMDKSFYSVMQSRFSASLENQLLQSYIQNYDERRNQIGRIFLNTKSINTETLNSDNSTRILIPLLDKLSSICLLEERLDAVLSLVDIFYRSQVQNIGVKISLLPDVLLREVIQVLLTAIKQEITRDYGVSTVAIWAILWLTNAKTKHAYTAYIFSDRELDILRKVIVDEKHDTYARSYAALILSICNSQKTIFSQADWIYEWADVADGGKPQKDLPRISYVERSKDIEAIKKLVISNLPNKIKRSAATSLGRLGCFIPEMVDSLLEIFKDETYLWEQRDEALVYLVFIGNSQVISELIGGVNQAENNTDKYGLRDRCFLALIGMGNVAVLKYQLELAKSEAERTYISAYAYALAGVASPLGRKVLESMTNHQDKEIYNAAIDALRKFKK
jgi:hypothetical protein